MDRTILGAKIRSERERKGFSLRAFAKECHISPSFLSDVELGKADPSLETLRVICERLDTSLAELLNENPILSP